MIARSWNSRIAKAARPYRVLNSLRSASTCRISAVEDSDSAKPIVTAAGPRLAQRARRDREQCRRDGDLREARTEDGVPQHPQTRWLQLEPDREQQHHDAELGEMQDALDIRDEPEAPRADDGTGGKVPEHGAQLEAAEERYPR
jgi:hypothetical protein